jgi:predicted GNAT family acetyltransferase
VIILRATSLSVEVYSDAYTFLKATGARLEKREVENSLLFGLAMRLLKDPDAYKTQPFYASLSGVAALMTPPHSLVLGYLEDVKLVDFTPLAEVLLKNTWPVSGVNGPTELTKAFTEVWRQKTGVAIKPGMQMRSYELREMQYIPDIPGRMRVADELDIDLIAGWITAFNKEAIQNGNSGEVREMAEQRIIDKDIYIWELNGLPVSMAMRTRPMIHAISISMVYTPPDLRRKGFASACVAALSQLLLSSGYESCCLYTDLSNPISNEIYQKIGYKPVRDMNEYFFIKEPV